MSKSNNNSEPNVTLDIKVPLSVSFEVVENRVNFVLEEGTDQECSPNSAQFASHDAGKYELHKIEG